ncbi:MAG: SDR family oxidoreductase [Caulobacter sp.]|nr:SDR family oxidoreductase [Caulobacter sp.]
MRVLVLGASGFIGSHVAASLAAAGHTVRAGARRPEAARRIAPSHDWVRAEFGDLTTPDLWVPLLADVDAVVNCVGVLQDSAGDSVRAAHVTGPAALIAACDAEGPTRLVHLSAVGADEQSGTAYGESKQATERLVRASRLDWVVLRPSLVLARGVYGGSALMRGLAAFPFVIPLAGGTGRFRPVAMEDLCAAVVALVEPGAPARLTVDVAGPETVSLGGLLSGLRGWLGLAPAPLLRLPVSLVGPVARLGDLLGWLGWPSALRTTSLRQMAHDVAGAPGDLATLVGVRPRAFTQWLSETPATVQDRWHARLYLLRPLAIVSLGVFWIATGLITVWPGWEAAVGVLRAAGYGEASPVLAGGGAVLDISLGGLLWVRRWSRAAAIGMALTACSYLLAGALSAPLLWLDPLGPLLKIPPIILLALFVAATDDRR